MTTEKREEIRGWCPLEYQYCKYACRNGCTNKNSPCYGFFTYDWDEQFPICTVPINSAGLS